MFERSNTELQHFLDYAKERGAKVIFSLAVDSTGSMVTLITVEPPNGKGSHVVFEDMRVTDELSQARILHSKRVLALW